jgi:hypothetical protein
MKIQKIEVRNFKALESASLDLQGASCIVTAGNNKGKSSLLRGLIARFQGQKPAIILKEGETEGGYTMELTDGSRIEWAFGKTERLTFTTKDGQRQTSGVLSSLGAKYFGAPFDINKFIAASQSEQYKMLQKLVGLDFAAIDLQYKQAYDARTAANREVERLRAQIAGMAKPVAVAEVDTTELKSQLATLEAENATATAAWQAQNNAHLQSLATFNKAQRDLEARRQTLVTVNWEASEALKKFAAETNAPKFLETTLAEMEKIMLARVPKPENEKPITSLPTPDLSDTTALRNAIAAAAETNAAATVARAAKAQYDAIIESGRAAAKKANELEAKVAEIKEQKAEMIRGAKLPAEFSLTEEGILYNGLPLSDEQISSSGKYIAALKLGFLAIGELSTMHFDASFLDNNSLKEVFNWATSQGLQLLVELPDRDGGEIRTEIVHEQE